jgi:hypothetical protein
MSNQEVQFERELEIFRTGLKRSPNSSTPSLASRTSCWAVMVMSGLIARTPRFGRVFAARKAEGEALSWYSLLQREAGQMRLALKSFTLVLRLSSTVAMPARALCIAGMGSCSLEDRLSGHVVRGESFLARPASSIDRQL